MDFRSNPKRNIWTCRISCFRNPRSLLVFFFRDSHPKLLVEFHLKFLQEFFEIFRILRDACRYQWFLQEFFQPFIRDFFPGNLSVASEIISGDPVGILQGVPLGILPFRILWIPPKDHWLFPSGSSFSGILLEVFSRIPQFLISRVISSGIPPEDPSPVAFGTPSGFISR